MDFAIKVIIRSLLAVLIGCLIGSERARHGRAAGMRTHIIVCLGSALTSMIGLYANEVLGYQGDVFRISAQVISGIGFLGAGMIILKNNATIMGLTTAAGVWTVSIIGIAIGFGFYVGAITATALFMIAIVLFAKLEKYKKTTEMVYIEIDDMYKANEIIKKLKVLLSCDFSHKFVPAKSGSTKNLGIIIIINQSLNLEKVNFGEIENIVFVEEES